MENNHITPGDSLHSSQSKDTQYFPVDGIPADDFRTNPDNFPEPITFDENPFPIDVFPDRFRVYIEESNHTLNYPIDYTATALIVAVSAAIGNTAQIKIKRGWNQPAIIYAALVGPSGQSKTHPMKGVMSVFEESDRKEKKRYRDDLKRYKEALKEYNKSKDKNAYPPQEPTPLQATMLTETTPEALVKYLQGNKRGCLMFSDELANFMGSVTAYQKGAQNLSFLLSAWNGAEITQHRVEEIRNVDHPFMSIIGGIQPRRIPDIFDKANIDNGLLQRFLWAYPEDFTKSKINSEEINQVVVENLHEWFKRFREEHTLEINPKTDSPQPTFYPLDRDAFGLYAEITTQITDRMNAYPDSVEREIISKFNDHLARLALVFQVMHNHTTKSISREAVEAAALVCQYFEFTAMKVANLIFKRGPLLDERKQRFFEALPDQFTTGEAIEIGGGQSIHERTISHWLNHSDSFKSLLSKIDTGKFRKKNR